MSRSVARGNHAATVNWGILDLAASVCTVKNPTCRECPLRMFCRFAGQRKLRDSWPVTKNCRTTAIRPDFHPQGKRGQRAHLRVHRDQLFTLVWQPPLGGARAQSVLMSVWWTCRQPGRSALDIVSQLLRGTPTALALPRDPPRANLRIAKDTFAITSPLVLCAMQMPSGSTFSYRFVK